MKTITAKRIIFPMIIFFVVFGWANSSQAATFSCNGSQSDCQAKITAASDGDTITIPSGSFNWGNSYISWTDKNINVIGAGIDQTIITSTYLAFNVTDETKASFRISGMTFNGNPSLGAFIKISSRYQTTAQAVYGWRVDHIKFTQTVANTSLYILGVNWGLIDHCDFENSASGSYELMHISIDTSYYNAESPYKSSYDWSLPIDWGTEKAVYIEDNVFNAPNVSGNGHPYDTQTGGRVVFRYNTVTGGAPLGHPPNNGQI